MTESAKTTNGDAEQKPREPRDICIDAAWGLPQLDGSDADKFIDNLIDGVIATLRADPKVIVRDARTWLLFFGDLRRLAADELTGLIEGRVDLDETIDAIARE